MITRMLIDARHLEETRVAVVKGSRIEEFDFESAEHKQLKGNIYLAKVTRVEPSLQAAFIDYGGNRHGFLAFSEIHPDYYQIPKSDRDALLREEAEHAAEEERLRGAAIDADDDDDHLSADAELDADVEGDFADDDHDDDDDDHHADFHGEDGDPEVPEVSEEGTEEVASSDRRRPSRRGRGGANEAAADELRRKRQNLRRRYKIQDVIQRRQVLLVQVVKEERGNKGAALTTYLSLAGRYCVLMPNTSHGGGISRKISNGADRKRLKSIMSDLQLPSSMGLIVRTAGLQRTKVEIKRDFDYLARLWDEVRENTLHSSAPALIYRDSDLVKRAIRDLYHREIDEVVVEGEDGYKAARGYMKLLMPSHVRRVKSHAESTPLFQLNGVEDQLSAMYQPVVQLKSGGYLVINPTEALVSIDINSGRSTREHNIEQTAFATNLEATAEIARQLRLRDMAGLVVIDFIDMEQGGHVRKVEKAMKEALRNDRARIQIGRISSFGLMEMSRQRLRTGVLEASTRPCAHCEGTGLMRTASSSGLSALRMIEDEAARGRGEKICLRAGREAAVYVLNKKRAELAEIEERYGVQVEVLVDDSYEGARMSVESSGPLPIARPRPAPVQLVDDEPEDDEDEFIEEDEEEEEETSDEPRREERGERAPREGEEGDDGARRGRRRRRRGGRNRRRDEGGEGGTEEGAVDEGQQDPSEAPMGDNDDEAFQPGDLVEQVASAEPAEAAEGSDAPQDEGDSEGRRSRRGRRGGRRRGGRDREALGQDGESVEAPAKSDEPHGMIAPDEAPMIEPVPSLDPAPEATAPAEEVVADDAPKTRRRPRARKVVEAATEPSVAAAPAADASVEAATGEEAPKPKRRTRAKKAAAPSEPAAEAELPLPEVAQERAPAAAEPQPEPKAKPAEAPAAAPTEESSDDSGTNADGSPRRGWWQRTFG